MLGMAAAGKLPNIQTHFIDGGVCVDAAIASMPALTYPNLVSTMTGLLPGHHGILGNQWFDRETLQIQDYLTVPTYLLAGADFQAPTIHDVLAEQFTVNVQFPARRGMDRTADNSLLTGCDWLLGTYTMTDARVGSDVAWVALVANEEGRWPVFSTFYFPGVDEIGHISGSDSRAYAAAVKNIDNQIGRVIAAIRGAQAAENLYFVLIADHGHLPLPKDRRLDVRDWLERSGLRVRHARINHSERSERARELTRFDAIVVDSGRRRVAVHLRSESGWEVPPSQAQIDKLLQKATCPGAGGGRRRLGRLTDSPAVACVAHKTPDGARVVFRGGEARIERRIVDGHVEYRVAGGDAATRLADFDGAHGHDAFDATQWHGSRDWLAATANSRWPDLVPQVVEMFDSPRAGDFVIFAAEDWGLARGDDGGHGSCEARDMRIPMYFAGPGLTGGAHVPCGRLVDVMPTMLDVLGESGRLASQPAIDGQSLLPALRHAGAAGESTSTQLDDASE